MDHRAERKRRITLDDDRKFALMKFRRNLQDILKPHQDDGCLLRWLRARNWNVDAAEKMFRASMDWREQWGVDGHLKTWLPNQVLREYVAFGITGHDPDGCPVAFVPIRGVDIVGLLHSASRHDFISFVIQLLESILEDAAKSGQHELIVVFDLEGFQLRPYTWRPASQLVIAMIQMYESNYPEILKACYLINAPRVFAIAFNVIKPFLDEYTISKIHVFKSDPKKFRRAMKEYIPDNALPKCYGGSLMDPNGDGKCPSKINYGGMVPHKLYKKNYEQDEKMKYTEAIVKNGGKLALEFSSREPGCYLHWNFSTQDHDIKFGIQGKDSDGNPHEVIKAMRVPSHQIEESGAIQCNEHWNYTVMLDNSYSLFKSKKIKHSIYMSEPISKLDVNLLSPVEE